MSSAPRKPPLPMRVYVRRFVLVIAAVELLFLATTWILHRGRPANADASATTPASTVEPPGSGR